MKALMSKWIVQALLPGQSNLRILLRYRITQLKPSCHGKWGLSSMWLFSSYLLGQSRSKVWHHIAHAWKVMTCTATFLSPSCSKDILQLNMQWHMEYQCFQFNITMDRAFVLYRKGLRYFRDVWDHGIDEFLSWEEASIKFSLPEVYWVWTKLVEHYSPFHERMLRQRKAQPTSQQWVGLYRNSKDELPKWVVCASYLKDFSFIPMELRA